MQIENLTLVMQRVLKLAAIEAEKDKDDPYVSVKHVLIGMLLEGNNFASIHLKDRGFTVEGLRSGRADIKCSTWNNVNDKG